MARSSGDTLSLNALAGATGNTQNSNVSLNTINGSAGTEVSFDDYGIDSVGSISGYTYLVEDTSDTYTLGFTGAGGKFSSISGRYQNFTWAKDEIEVESDITISSNQDATATVTAKTDIGGASQTLISITSNQQNTLQVTFADGFNDHATNYNTVREKTIYVVDSYDGNSDALCLSLDTPITKADGTIISAGDVQEGDVLKGFEIATLGEDSDDDYLNWSTNDLSTTSEDVTVTNIVFSFADRIYDINNGELQITGEHPMLVKVDNTFKFKPALDIQVGEYLVKGDNSLVEVTSKESTVGSTEVVSIDVETEDTYLVNGYITHNKGGNTFSDPLPSAVTGLSYSDPDLSWTAYTGASDYSVQVDNNSDFSSPIINKGNWNDTSMQVRLGASPFNLTDGTTYYARVAARKGGRIGTYSNTLTFEA